MIIIKVKDFGEIKLELQYGVTQNTAANFVELARKGFYNGLIFHRVIRGFMIQGGDPSGNGMGGPGYSIKGEFRQNGVNNTLAHTRGVISMARTYEPDSAGSQFFIMHKDAPHLDGAYASFGKVVEGIEVVDKIAKVNTSRSDRPLTPVIIEKVEVIDEPTFEVIKL